MTFIPPRLVIGTGDSDLAMVQAAHVASLLEPLEVAQAEQDTSDGPHFLQLDIETDDIRALPEAGYAVVTCRLVFAFIKDKAAFLDRIRYLLPPGGTFWVVIPLAERFPEERKSIGISPQYAELLTASWSSAYREDLDTLRCYALRP
ncbi:class I SAM-dependent methyltransferase [Streptomyces bluensis]|uniref:class I SAM-dependent methyltransferase n=1 Tax=Streptomyces bluensis TaxID=33897 RepID=UPI00167BE6E6|nr:class I SAM-dependent methyltransferase [Streptomyces bluensis]GGZ70307.1 hypothetical protein GCM10010344_41610 [Streptomyces bluensis]